MAQKVSTLDIINVIKEARELISDPNNWTQSHFATDINKNPVHYEASNATSFSAFGAVQRAASNATDAYKYKYELLTLSALKHIKRELKKTNKDLYKQSDMTKFRINKTIDIYSLIEYNDSKFTAHKDVLALLDAVIRRLEGIQ